MKTIRTVPLLLVCACFSLLQVDQRCAAQLRGLEARSVEAFDAVYKHNMKAMEAEARLRRLNPDEIVNAGALAVPIDANDTETRMREIVAGCENYTPWLTLGKIKKGQIGRPRYPTNVGTSKQHAIVEILQVIGKGKLLGKMFGETYLLKGMDTSGLVDGKEFILSNSVHVTGTETYNTRIGTNTVMKLEVTEQSKLADSICAEFKSEPPNEYGDCFRLWKAKNGVTIVAKYLERGKKDCKFEKLDNSIIEVKKTKLSSDAKKTITKIEKRRKETRTNGES